MPLKGSGSGQNVEARERNAGNSRAWEKLCPDWWTIGLRAVLCCFPKPTTTSSQVQQLLAALRLRGLGITEQPGSAC